MFILDHGVTGYPSGMTGSFIANLLFIVSCIFFSNLVIADSSKQHSTQQAKQRIVSMNLCIDQLVWRLVDHQRLLSLSYLAADPQWSPIASQVSGKYLNRALAEEIVPLNADLILAGEFDAPDAISLLTKLNEPMQRLKTPQSLRDIQQQWLDLGQLTGDSQLAWQLAETVDQQMQLLSSQSDKVKSTKVYWYTANGVVIGGSTLEDELMTLAGFRNLAKEQGVMGFSPLDLEMLLANKPDALIIDTLDPSHYSLAQEFLSHPALQNSSINLIRLPAGFSSCSVDMVKDFTQAVVSYLNQESIQ